MLEAPKVAKFGSVIPITGLGFMREVLQAPSDVWVIVILYKEEYFMRDLNTKLIFLDEDCSDVCWKFLIESQSVHG